MFKFRVLLPMAVWLVLAPAWSQAPSCDALPEQAESIRAMRDHDPAGGLERGRELLERMDDAGRVCAAGRMLVHGAIASNLHILGRNQDAIEAVEAALALAGSVDDPAALSSISTCPSTWSPPR